MKEFFIIISIAAALIGGLVFFILRNRRAKLVKKIEDSFPFDVSTVAACQYKTPKGARVKTVNPVAAIDEPQFLAAIDRGFDLLFERTSGLGYSSHRSHSDFLVVCYPPTYKTIREGYPALTMRNGQTVAGTCIGLERPELVEPFIAVAENTQFFDYLTECVYNESEHFALFYNDREKFYFYTGANDAHPIFKFEAAL